MKWGLAGERKTLIRCFGEKYPRQEKQSPLPLSAAMEAMEASIVVCRAHTRRLLASPASVVVADELGRSSCSHLISACQQLPHFQNYSLHRVDADDGSWLFSFNPSTALQSSCFAPNAFLCDVPRMISVYCTEPCLVEGTGKSLGRPSQTLVGCLLELCILR